MENVFVAFEREAWIFFKSLMNRSTELVQQQQQQQKIVK